MVLIGTVSRRLLSYSKYMNSSFIFDPTIYFWLIAIIFIYVILPERGTFIRTLFPFSYFLYEDILISFSLVKSRNKASSIKTEQADHLHFVDFSVESLLITRIHVHTWEHTKSVQIKSRLH